MNIVIKYDGKYPNLCSGQLIVIIDGTEWVFPEYCLSSGGGVWFDNDWLEHVDSGCWSIVNWPENFPEDKKEAVVDAVNDQIEQGCCGGCV